jgi:hypothetical protein
MSKEPLLAIGNRARVARLLNGDTRKEDLHELFNIMREDVRGSGWVAEITHFFAHPNKRDQGSIWRDVSDHFAFLKFRIPLNRSSIITHDLPASMPNALRANLRRMRKTTLLRETGKNRVQAEKILARVLSRVVPTGPGRLSRLTIKNQEEWKVLTCVASHSKGGPIFTINDVFEDFCRGLQKRNLLQADEKPTLKEIKPAIALYCLTAMHDRKVDLGPNGSAILTIGADIYKRLGLFAISEVVPDYGRGSFSAMVWVFETDLPIAEHCEPMVPPLHGRIFIGDFEMTQEWRLARI